MQSRKITVGEELKKVLHDCDKCSTYSDLCRCFDAKVRPLLDGCLFSPLAKPVRDHVSPDECSPRVVELRESLCGLKGGSDDVWFLSLRAAGSLLERATKKRAHSERSDMSALVVNVFVLFYGRTLPDLSKLRLRWTFLQSEKAAYETSEAYVHSNAVERRKALMTSVLSVFSERAHRHYFTSLWMPCLQHAAEATLHVHLLYRMGSVILPYLTNPLVVADYLSDCFTSGGLIAVLALHGIFILMLDHGLEYPKYYHQLYTLLTPDSFASRHRYDLFRLLDVSMTSLRVPAYIAAAFAKRIARVATLSPSPVLYFVLPFIRKILQRHPNCLALIHRSAKEALVPDEVHDGAAPPPAKEKTREAQLLAAALFDGNDPFVIDANPEDCCALYSSLWEITALERHFIPTVPLMVSVFSSPAEDQAPLRYEKTYMRLFTAEVTREISKSQLPTVAYRQPEWDMDALLHV
uniref:CCAAT-binding factor domain-containing protein n=1 Tax=Trypanosoma congolense (strain IL3000) TaxID=1068625 RepID=G0ULG7_TRYCI|nr:conserved hypothetical protein [Trypanosoma congolense IL3000]